MKLILGFIGIILPLMIFAHGTEEHPEKKPEKKDNSQQMHQLNSTDKKGHSEKIQMNAINKNYQIRVKGIFEEKCADCHGTPDKFPWYYMVPGIKQIMDYDIREAKKHIEMSNDFPFGGHGTPQKDLKTLKKTVQEDSMPPLRYWIIQPGKRIKTEDRKVILEWIEQSESLLN